LNPQLGHLNLTEDFLQAGHLIISKLLQFGHLNLTEPFWLVIFMLQEMHFSSFISLGDNKYL